MNDLKKRFEPPNDKNRWDFPLFHVNMTPKVNSTIIESQNEATLTDNITTEILLEPSKPTKSSWKPKPKKKSSSISEISITTAKIDSINLINAKVNNDQLSFSGSFLDKSLNNNKSNTIENILPKILLYFQSAIVPLPNTSTISVIHADADVLYQLDYISKSIIDLIVVHQNSFSEGTPLILTEYNCVFELQRIVSSTELIRHQRQYVKINSQHPPVGKIAIGLSFIDFLTTQI